MNQPARAKLDSVDLYTDVARDLWQVQLPDGICAMGIEELDAAFERGEIGLHTRVQRPSGGDWRTLGEAAGAYDSIRPVSSEIALVEVPRPPPLPKHVAAVETLTTEDLAVLPKPRKTGARLAAVAVIGLLAGGLAAWRYMPAHPIGATATTTILAPTTQLASAPPPTAPLPAAALAASPSPSPETSPAPEENAAPLAGSVVASASPAAAVKKAMAKPAKKTTTTTWKHRAKLHAATKKKPA